MIKRRIGRKEEPEEDEQHMDEEERQRPKKTTPTSTSRKTSYTMRWATMRSRRENMASSYKGAK